MPDQLEIFAIIRPEGGSLSDSDTGLLASSVRLAEQLGCPWQAVALGEPDRQAVDLAGRYGTSIITIVESGLQYNDQPERMGAVLAALLRGKTLPLVLLPHNDLGITLAPLLAVQLDGGLVAEARQIRRLDGFICLEQAVLGKAIVDRRGWYLNRPLIATLPMESLSSVELPPGRHVTTQCVRWVEESVDEVVSTRIIERIGADPTTVDLTEADIILCAGKGCSKENFAQLEELCVLLKTSLGVTRPVYDLGWCGFERMIGQTGRTVKPRLYISFGVSGSMHHVGGIKDSVCIVAVNSDAKAPIFPNADEGYVADVNEVLPILVQQARSFVEDAPSNVHSARDGGGR